MQFYKLFDLNHPGMNRPEVIVTLRVSFKDDEKFDIWKLAC